MAQIRDACTVCDTVQPADDLWRITRRPNDPIEWVEERAFCDTESMKVQIAGPSHLLLCRDCWHKAIGFLEMLHNVRKERSA